MDFKKPRAPVSINGFPVHFRKDVFSEKETFWLPRGISRNEDLKAWRIWFRHADGEFSDYIFDGNRNKEESLDEAWSNLKAAYKGYRPYELEDYRNRAPGFRQNPDLNLGYTGVWITRQIRSGAAGFTVNVGQAFYNQKTGKKMHRVWVAVRCTRKRFEDNPESEQGAFEEGVRRAIAVRRYYNRLVSQCVPLTGKVTYEDVPQDIKDKPAPFPKLQLDDIFQSF